MGGDLARRNKVKITMHLFRYVHTIIEDVRVLQKFGALNASKDFFQDRTYVNSLFLLTLISVDS